MYAMLEISMNFYIIFNSIISVIFTHIKVIKKKVIMSSLQAIQKLKQHVQNHIIGQETLVDRLLIALLADGHLLVDLFLRLEELIEPLARHIPSALATSTNNARR